MTNPMTAFATAFDPAVVLGMATGVVSAFIQSCSYIVSGTYVKRTGRPGWTLALPQRFVMAPFYAALAWFFRPQAADADLRGIILACLCMLAGVLAGDTGLFQMQRTVEPSRVAPLQAVKIPIIAVISFLLLEQSFGPMKILAIAFVLGSAALLFGAGRRIRLPAWGWLLVCTTGFAASDLSIGRVLGLTHDACGGVLRSSLFALGLTHFVSAVFGFAGYCVQRGLGAERPRGTDWIRYVIPYGALWMVSMVFLFVCFSLAGVVPGTIAQSTRGLISVMLGWALARHGFADVDAEVPRSVFFRRILAALLVMAAMAAYAL